MTGSNSGILSGAETSPLARVTGGQLNGAYTLPGYAGSAFASLEVTDTALVKKIKEEYTGRERMEKVRL